MTTTLFSLIRKKAVQTKLLIAVFIVAWCCFYSTAIDRTDWWIENILVFLFAGIMIFAGKKPVLSQASIGLIFCFLLVHLYGAQGAYTHNQFGEWLKMNCHLARNPYDRIVHFSFGFLLIIPFFELCRQKMAGTKAQILLTANMAILCLAAIFELIEWGVAACTDAATGATYVATQGDPWDAQKDILLAVLGAVLCSFILRRTKLYREKATS